MARTLFKMKEGVSFQGNRGDGTDNGNIIRIIKGNVDPTSTAVEAEAGSLFLRTDSAALYIKTDGGSTTNWSLVSTGSGAEDGFQNTFIGKSGLGSETPTYSSTNVVTDGNSLESEIGALDAEIGAAIATAAARTTGAISDQAINLNIEALDDAIGPDVTSTNYAVAADAVNANISALDVQIKTNADAISALSSGISWRDPVIALTEDGDLQTAIEGATLSTLLPFSDDEGTQMVIGDFSADDYILSKNSSGTDRLWQVYDDTGTLKLTLVGFNALATGNTFFVINDLSDSPAAQEGNSLFSYNGTDLVKIADVDWSVATGISLSGTYTAASGTVASGDSVEEAIEKVDGNNIATTSAVGSGAGNSDMGTYTGSIITDNQTAKQNIQELETEIESLETSITGTSITTSSNSDVDTISVSTENVMGVEWTFGCDDSVAVGRYMGRVIALTNSAGTSVDYNEFSILEVGTAPTVTASVTASAGSINLNIANGSANTITVTVTRKILRTA